MLRKEDFVMIQDQARAGVYQKDIAAQLGVHPKTVSRALKRGAAPLVGRPRGFKKLRPYQDTVDRLLSEGVWNAVVIIGLLKAQGYAGGYSQLKRYILPKRVLQPSKNQKCAVLEHRVGERPRFHPRFLDLAGHCGFAPRACQRGRARTKGKDELRNTGWHALR